MKRLLEKLREAVEAGTFVKLTLGHPLLSEGARRLLARPVEIRAERHIAVVSRFATRDETKNFLPAAFLALVAERLGGVFGSAHLFTETEEIQFDGRRLRTRAAERAPASLGHDRLKARRLDPRERYLAELGVCDAKGRVRERMGDKFRQIERFLDLLASAWRESGLEGGGQAVELVDMGAGKGYLTFAAAVDFARLTGQPVRVTGVEARAELVTLCNGVAERCGLAERLRFIEGRIGETPLERADILVALHACNTATDDALAAGVRAGAGIILAAPCCHKEARPQLDAEAGNSGPLRDVLRYGLFAERHAEMATDALRALLLEREGYKVRVAEFVAAEHTAKNVMLLATRRGAPLQGAARAEWAERFAALKAFYGIRHHHLEEALHH